MDVRLTHRNFGIHEQADFAAVEGEFADYAKPAEPGNKDRDDWVIDEDKLLAALPEGFLPVQPGRILLGVENENGGTAHSACKVFRRWAKYFDAYMLWLVEPAKAEVANPVTAESATDLVMPPLRHVTQSILYSPENEQAGIYGNCLAAAIASALDMELEAVPNFAAFTWYEAAVRLWLRGQGWDWRMVPLPVPAERSIVVGQSPRPSGLHAVVGEGGEVVWDPHPDRTGLTVIRHSYVLERWPVPGVASGCVICGSRSDAA